MGKRKTSMNYILTYYQQIRDGSVTVGKWIELVYEYLVHGIESGLFRFDQKKANAAIEFIETHCFHTEGDLAPGALKLEIWQKALISAAFGIVDEKGARQFREVVLVIARKNGKSLMGSGIGRYIWKTGGFGARCYCVAPKLDQADIIYSSVWAMTQLDPEYKEKKSRMDEARKKTHSKVDDDPTIERHRMGDLFIPDTNSTFKKIAFSAKKSDGFNPSICICDEFAAWPAEQGLKQYEVMKSGMGARSEPMLLSLSTAGYINDGIYDELLKRSTRFLMGESRETRLLPFLYMIDDVERWNDINELRKAMPNLGVSVSVDYMLEEIAIAEGSLSKKSEFLCKYCNIKQNSSTAWLDTKTVGRAIGEPLRLEDFRDSYAVVGIDLSQTTDLTAVTTVIEKGGKLYVFGQFFMPREKVDEATAREGLPYRAYVQRGLLTLSGDNFVEYSDVFNYCVRLVEDLKIYPLKVGYDRYSSQYLVQDLKGYGFHCDDVYQGENLSGVIDEVEGLMKDGKIQIGDNDLLKMHLLNSALKRNTETNRKRLVKVNQTLHIDGAAALLDAMTVRQKWHSEIGEQLKNER